jgi:hypothetical protein
MIFLKIKLAYQKWKLGKKYDYIIKKNGHLIFKKEKEIWNEYLSANKRGQTDEECRLKGWVECLKWFLDER